MKLRIILVVLLLINSSFFAEAKQIISSVTESSTFTSEKVDKEASWSSNLKITSNGLIPTYTSWKDYDNFWLQTQPIGVGRSSNPFIGFGFSAFIKGEMKSAKYNGINLYFRYGCDREHWSTWYPLEKETKKTEDGREIYKGFVNIPKIAREKFEAMKNEWAKTKPANKDDIHELAKWIVIQEPNFFSKELPFVGYIQIRLEAESVESIKLKEIKVEYTIIESGLIGRRHTIDENGNIVPVVMRSDANNKWFFVAKPN